MQPELTQARAYELVERITRDDHEIAVFLFELLRGVVDPNGDRDRFAVGDEAMKRVIVKTPEFEEWYREKLTA